MISLYIKGNRQQAARAAKARGVALTIVREQSISRGIAETVARTTPEHRAAVVAWFAEEPRQAPFPVGALLHYGESD